jgi:hypothetical protein
MKSNEKEKSLIADSANILVKAIFKDNVLSQIPWVQTALALREAYSNLQNEWIIKKMQKYAETEYIATEQEIKEFMKKITDVEREDLDDIIMHGLNSAESVLKTVYLKRLIDSTIRKRCSIEKGKHIAFIIQSMYGMDIGEILNELIAPNSNSNGFKEKLHSFDILERSMDLERNLQNDPQDIGVDYRLTDFGDVVIKTLFPDQYDKFNEKNRSSLDLL